MEQPYAGLKVAALAADLEACGNYRLVHPFAQLEKLGAQTRIFTKVCHDDLRDYQIIIAQRQSRPESAQLLRTLRREGRLIIADTDDMLDAVHPANPAYRAYMPGSVAQRVYHEIIAGAHGVTVTTQELATHYSALNRNVHVVPNCIDFGIREWPAPVFRDTDALTIGWTGSTSHLSDMNVLGAVIEAILEKYPHVRYGHFAHKDLLTYLSANFKIPADRVEIVPPVGFDEYPSRLTTFDIGLAPLMVSPFNMAKSPLKLMEYSAIGIPFVASKVAPYTRYTDQGVDGYVVGSTSEWVSAISTLIEDTQLRRCMSDAACTKVREKHSIESGAAQWVRAWMQIRDAAIAGDLGPAQASAKIIKPGRNEPCPCGSGIKYKKCCSPSWG